MSKVGDGLHTDRLTDPRNGEELRFVKAWKKLKKDSAILSWLLGNGSTRAAVSARDTSVAATVVQWLGTETGVEFLRSLGYVKTEEFKPKKSGVNWAKARVATKEKIATEVSAGNSAFARELCKRLNTLVSYYHEDVSKDVQALLEERVHVGDGTVNHPSIQCTNCNSLGVLGLLNGVIYPDCPDHGKFTKIAIQVKADGSYTFITLEDE